MMGNRPDERFFVALLAGGMAGTSVDVTLFPLDTVKTRLQSPQGFQKAGGFRGIYSGLASAALGSAPTAALFFCMYELVKFVARRDLGESWAPISHMTGAALGEVTACTVRVPVEVVKQRTQASPGRTSLYTLRNALSTEGFRGLYRGYLSTVMREVPFSFLQFPMWEYFKVLWSNKQGYPVLPWQSSLCGALAGCLAASITTPLDVAKTRIMLAKKDSRVASGSILYALKRVHSERGIPGLFSGMLPRMMWISMGGAIFLGVYDKSKLTLNQFLCDKQSTTNSG